MRRAQRKFLTAARFQGRTMAVQVIRQETGTRGQGPVSREGRSRFLAHAWTCWRKPQDARFFERQFHGTDRIRPPRVSDNRKTARGQAPGGAFAAGRETTRQAASDCVWGSASALPPVSPSNRPATRAHASMGADPAPSTSRVGGTCIQPGRQSGLASHPSPAIRFASTCFCALPVFRDLELCQIARCKLSTQQGCVR